MPSLRRSRPLKVLLLLLCAAPAGAAAPPDPQQLLQDALNPDVAFQGRMMVTHWFGRQTQAEEVEVYHALPNLTRREFFAPDGTVQRVMISDGDTEEILGMKRHKVVSGDAVKSYDKVMKPERELELLVANYELSVSSKTDEMAGRKAWVLQLKPKITGKPWQRLWIDQEAGLILENKRFLPRQHFAVLSRYSRIDIDKKLDPKLFALTLSSTAIAGAGSGLAPDFMTLEELKKAVGHDVRFPAELPAGFAFESADHFTYKGHEVLHARYTDGLDVLSLFETDRPVAMPKGGTAAVAPPSKGSGSGIRLSMAGRVLAIKRGKRYLTLISDVSAELLKTISARLK